MAVRRRPPVSSPGVGLPTVAALRWCAIAPHRLIYPLYALTKKKLAIKAIPTPHTSERIGAQSAR
ncbi:hypothetical protein GCM10017655_00820 [Pseudomonas turukhanskensis]|uniref:Uncharacterized protein n=1 Tax=Pseudomonas turukhanskensis TaxID=1806536 RepID=A0A9W6K3F3_9PSED|nr:hypothetical protein GCM10017655_00820 [Pseudomonas turukhanskensis]